MRRQGERTPREKAAAGEMKSVERKAEQGAEQYQCSGLLERDFPELCARAGIAAVPRVTLRPPPSFPADAEPPEPTLAEVLAGVERKLEARGGHAGGPEPVPARAGWAAGSAVSAGGGERGAMGSPPEPGPDTPWSPGSLWKVGLTERLLPALAALAARCPRLRMLSLEGNPLPEPAFHVLMGSDSALAHLSLRNNGIGDAGARLIGQSLGTPSSPDRGLRSLVLSFNRISDLGAGYIAQGLRLNRSLLSLSLASNDIGDAGAVRLAEVLGPFALTHTEVVERRRLLWAEALGRSRTTPKESEGQSEHPSAPRGRTAPSKLPPAKLGRTPAKKKEEAKQPKKPPEPRAARSREAKPSGPEKPSLEVPDSAEPPHPLLEEAREHRGSVVLPGNRALLNLNLSYNRVTERGLGAFLAALEVQQREKKPKVPGQQGLLCLSLENNHIPAASPAFARLQELLPPPAPGPGTPSPEEEPGPGT